VNTKRILVAFFLLANSAAIADEEAVCLMRSCVSPDKVVSDFNDIVSKLANFYGPLSFKEQKYNFTLSELAEKTREKLRNTPSDADAIGQIKKFLACFHDAHISLHGGLLHEMALTNKMIPLSVIPIDNKFLVSNLDDGLKSEGIEPLDEVVAIDGQDPLCLLAMINQYECQGHDLANFRTNADFLFFRRYFMRDLFPTNDIALIRFRSRTTGEIYDRTLIWRTVAGIDGLNMLEKLKEHSPFRMGPSESFFMSAPVRGLFRMKDEGVKISKDEKDERRLSAFLYKHKGKVVLLVRQNTYSPQGNYWDWLQAYRKLMSEMYGLADVIVIDQTNNPGGNPAYAIDFFRIFSGKNSRNLVAKPNADLGSI
jgi:hypothetical protein